MSDPDSAARALQGCAELVETARELAASSVMASGLDGGNSLVARVDAEVADALARLRRAQAQVDSRIQESQQEQVERVIDAGAALQINIGPGGSPVDGWTNVDLGSGDVFADLRRPLPFPDSSASHIYCAHVLEHLRNPDESHVFLRECRRVLRRGGKIRVVVPDIGHYLQACLENDTDFWETHQKTWPWSRVQANRLDQTLRYAGAGPFANDFFGHQHGYDSASLVEVLRSAGFTPVKLSEYQQSPDETFRIDHRSAVAHARHNGRSLSLFAEGFSIF